MYKKTDVITGRKERINPLNRKKLTDKELADAILGEEDTSEYEET